MCVSICMYTKKTISQVRFVAICVYIKIYVHMSIRVYEFGVHVCMYMYVYGVATVSRID